MAQGTGGPTRPGRALVVQPYTPRQLEFGTGGPPAIDLLADLATLRAELAGLDFFHASELEREVVEGQFHTGRAAVVQLLARKA